MGADTQKVLDVLKATGFYFDPDHPDYVSRDKIDSLVPPFLEVEEQDMNFYADDVSYYTIPSVEVRLYSDLYATDESTVDTALKTAGYSFEKQRQLLPQLELWETIYTTEI